MFNLVNLLPTRVSKQLLGMGWQFKPAANAGFAAAIRKVVKIPVIANGGFQDRDVIEGALTSGQCHMLHLNETSLSQLRRDYKTGHLDHKITNALH